ncbi:MAG: hypothetical protein ISS76_08970, partial [Phycisphaerae bacterium]|nr:hypothetical protein [Phycisphaerae bacterium]
MKWLNGYRMRLVLIVFVAAIVLGGGSAKADFIWTQKADMPTPRWSPTSAVVNGKIYVIGGSTSEPGDKVLSTVEEYDPVTDTWTTKADMPTARGWTSPSSAVVDGKIFVIGGWDGSKTISTVEEYDPTTDTWTRKVDMPTQRTDIATCTVDGKVYAIGGYPPVGYAALKTVEMYDPETGTWTRKADMSGTWTSMADMPLAAGMLNACVVRGKIYAIGGRPDLKSRTYVQEYDPATNTWTRKADMPVGTSQMASVVLGNKIIVIGGWLWSLNYPYRTVQMYAPETDTWTIEGDAPFLRAAFSADVVNNRIYVIGGTNRPHPCPATSTVYELTINPPPPDFNGDGMIDSTDVCIMVDYWGTDEPLCDIAPPPFGDGIVDVQDLIVLSEHLLPVFMAHWELDEAEGGIACDSVGGHDGTLNGNPIWQPAGGKTGGALQLDGIDDYISADFTWDTWKMMISASAWIKGDVPGQVIISQTDGDGTGYGASWLYTDSSSGTL